MSKLFLALGLLIIGLSGCATSVPESQSQDDMPLTRSEADQRVENMTPAEKVSVIESGRLNQEIAASIEPAMNSMAGKFGCTAERIGDIAVAARRELRKNNIKKSVSDVIYEMDAGTTRYTASKVDLNSTMAIYVMCTQEVVLNEQYWKDEEHLPFRDRLSMIATAVQ